MATKHYENGIVATTAGGSTDIATDIFVTGVVYWVDSVNGNDGNAGTDRNAPKATLASALSAATANNGDIIILEANHAETLSGAVAISKAGLGIFGLGSGSTKPSFTVAAAVDGFNISGDAVEINGLRFPVGTTAGNTSRINAGADAIRIIDCDFYCGAQDAETITIPANMNDVEINGCSFTVSADGPDSAIEVEDATVTGLRIISCSFDGGDYNFDNAAIYSAVAHTEFLYRSNTLTNKAHIIHTAASKGWCIGTVAGDGSRVEV